MVFTPLTLKWVLSLAVYVTDNSVHNYYCTILQYIELFEPVMNKFLTAFFSVATFTLFCHKTQAQHYYYNENFYEKDLVWEVGTGVGVMGSITDLGKKGFNFSTANVTSGFYVAAMYKNFIGARFEMAWGKVEAADSMAVKGSPAFDRNLNFRSNITEFSLLGEFHPLLALAGENVPKFSPYLLAGVGWFTFNPQTNLNGRWINLAPLRTEGQTFEPFKATREKYNLSQVTTPVGIGVKYELSQLLTIRGEFLYRFLYTDYLDDVSKDYIDPALFNTYLSPANAALARAVYSRGRELDPNFNDAPGVARGNSANNDSYWTASIKLGINLGRPRR